MNLKKFKILFVDDEIDIVAVMKRGLELNGFDVDTFIDPLEALNHFKPDYYDDIILDIKMPNLTGFELARKIWQQDEDAKICFMSAFDVYEPEAKKVFPRLNSFCFITKPVNISNLVKHINMHLSR